MSETYKNEDAVWIEVAMDDAAEKAADPKRRKNRKNRIGASWAGQECDRKIWFNLRHASPPEKHGARTLRLFAVGHEREEEILADLSRICDLSTHDENGKQHSVSLADGWLFGYMDGYIHKGLPTHPHEQLVVEIKTGNAADYRKLTREGVRKAKPLHWQQMQLYLAGTEARKALYIFEERDKLKRYFEIVHADNEAADRLIKNCQDIALDDTMPHPVSYTPDAFSCKFCDHKSICHKLDDAVPPERTCRSCAHASLVSGGRVICSRPGASGANLSFDEQIAGCSHHFWHPELWQDDASRIEENGNTTPLEED